MPALRRDAASSAIESTWDGRRTTINVEPDFSPEALELYLSLQRRFQRSEIGAADLRPEIERNWRDLRARSGRILPADREP